MRLAIVAAAGAAALLTLGSAGCSPASDTTTEEEASTEPTWSKASLMGDLLDNEETAAVLEAHLPDVPIADYRDMIAEMSLEELAENPQAYMIAEKLEEIDADLRALE